MQRLFLLRHGIAVPHGSPDFPDNERPLTDKGERRVRQVAYGLKQLKLGLDRIFTSPLPRAFRTAEIVARVLGDPDLVETADALSAHQTAADIVSWLPTMTFVRVMLVGHNPSLSRLIGLLLIGEADARIFELRKAGLAAFSPREDDEARMKIEWLARPRLIRRLSDR